MADHQEDNDPFEEDIVFDEAGLLGGKMPRARRQATAGFLPTFMLFIRTVFLCVAFLGLGLCVSVSGSPLIKLEVNAGIPESTAFHVFTARSVGMLFGGALGSVLFEVYNRQFLLSVSLVWVAASVTVLPFTVPTALWWTLASTAALGMGLAFLFTGGNVLCLDLWGRKQGGAALQALHFSFALGALVVPLVVQPFFANLQAPNATLATNLTTTALLPTTTENVLAVRKLRAVSPEESELPKNLTTREILSDLDLMQLTLPVGEAIASASPTSLSSTSLVVNVTSTTSTSPQSSPSSTTTTTTSKPIKKKPENTNGDRLNPDEKPPWPMPIKRPPKPPVTTAATTLPSTTTTTTTTAATTVLDDLQDASRNGSVASTTFISSSSTNTNMYSSSVTTTSTDARTSQADSSTTAIGAAAPSSTSLSPTTAASSTTTSATTTTTTSPSASLFTSVAPPTATTTTTPTTTTTIFTTTTTATTTTTTTPASTTITTTRPLLPVTQTTTTTTTSTTTPITTTTTTTTIKPQTTSITTTTKGTTPSPVRPSPVLVTDTDGDDSDADMEAESVGGGGQVLPLTSEIDDLEGRERLAGGSGGRSGSLKPGTFSNGSDDKPRFLDHMARRLGDYGVTRVHLAYISIGILVVVDALVSVVVLCHHPREARSRQEGGPMASSRPSRAILFTVLFSAFMFAAEALQGALHHLLASTGGPSGLPLSWGGEGEGPDGQVVFWGLVCLVRFLCVPAAGCLGPRPGRLLAAAVFFALAGSAFLVVGSSGRQDFTWAGVVFLAVGVAPVLPTSLLWMAQHMRVTHRLCALMVVVASFGNTLTHSLLAGVADHPPTYAYLVLGLALASTCLLGLSVCAVHASHHTDNMGAPVGYQLASQHEEDSLELTPSASVVFTPADAGTHEGGEAGQALLID